MLNFSLKKFVERIIFSCRWLLIPFYLKLFWTLTKLTYHFYQGHVGNDELMELFQDVDITMIANLVKMIITGSYHSFVDKTHGVEGEQVTSGALKVKMAQSIVGVSSIHLLKTFVEESPISMDILYKQIILHALFIIGCVALAFVDFLHSKSYH